MSKWDMYYYDVEEKKWKQILCGDNIIFLNPPKIKEKKVMNQAYLEKIMLKMIKEELEESRKKGADYSSKSDRFSNFKRISQDLDIPVLQVWFVYFKKHVDSIAKYCKGETLQSEAIEGRIKDCRVYLALLRAFIEDVKEQKEGDIAEEAALSPHGNNGSRSTCKCKNPFEDLDKILEKVRERERRND